MDRQTLAELASHLEPEISNAEWRITESLRDDAFGEMCSEYEECLRSLCHWNRDPVRHGERITEFGELMENLRGEIKRYLRDAADD